MILDKTLSGEYQMILHTPWNGPVGSFSALNGLIRKTDPDRLRQSASRVPRKEAVADRNGEKILALALAGAHFTLRREWRRFYGIRGVLVFFPQGTEEDW